MSTVDISRLVCGRLNCDSKAEFRECKMSGSLVLVLERLDEVAEKAMELLSQGSIPKVVLEGSTLTVLERDSWVKLS